MIIAIKNLNKKRFIKVPGDVETLLNDYADAHPHEEDFLFANKNGEQLRIRTLQYRFKKQRRRQDLITNIPLMISGIPE